VIEAMKVRNEIEAPKNGRISSILVKENTIVKKGEVIAKIE
ncbi:MAG: biotin/lipoyl-binding protein, partial [Candidatus Korarchaeota archaeon]|nr:biotin/lipoyl-binding protein [Candidatus Korarchaeota archaeon]